jgi:lipid-A-disaccharide synthase
MILRLKPKAVLFIDYPGFNLRMEKTFKEEGIPRQAAALYLSFCMEPRQGRIALMEKTLDELFCILPFEPDCFPTTRSL